MKFFKSKAVILKVHKNTKTVILGFPCVPWDFTGTNFFARQFFRVVLVGYTFPKPLCDQQIYQFRSS